jgi:hypothetical protein
MTQDEKAEKIHPVLYISGKNLLLKSITQNLRKVLDPPKVFCQYLEFK